MTTSTATREQIEAAAAVLYGTKPTCAAEHEAARLAVMQAARSGWKFFPNLGGSAAAPNIVVQAPVAA